MANVTIDGKTLDVEDGILILNAAKQVGIEIPTFCSHPRLQPLAACRLCLIEVEGQRKLLPACATTVTDGMVIHTQSSIVLNTREATLEFLLANHPLDCPVCDKGGECRLQDMVFAHRPGEGRFQEHKRRFHNRDQALNAVIIANLNRCIQCQLCVRYCDEVVGAQALGAIGRGSEQNETGFLESLDGCDSCGNCVEVCPVGALMSRPYRYKTRPWDLTEVETICPYCATGCQLTVSVKDGRLMRVHSKQERGLNHEALCVRGRFGMDVYSLHQENKALTRIHHPMIRKDGELKAVSWDLAVSYIREHTQRLQQQGKTIGGLISPGMTNETIYSFKKMMLEAFHSEAMDTFCRWPLGKAYPVLENLIERFYLRTPITELLKADCVVVIGCNVTDENPVSEYIIRQSLSTPRHETPPFNLSLISARPSRLDRIANGYQRYLPGQEPQLLTALLDLVSGEKRAEECAVPFITNLSSLLKQAQSISLLVGIDFLRSPCVTQTLQLLNTLLDKLSSEKTAGMQFLLDRSNQLGAWDIGVTSQCDFNAMLTQCEQEQMGLLYVVDEDPLITCPDRTRVERTLSKLDLLVVQDAFLSETAQQADVVLPGVTCAESVGTFTNSEGRVQQVRPFYPAIKPQSPPVTRLNMRPTGEVFYPPRYQSEAKPDIEIFNTIATALGTNLGLSSAESIFTEIAEMVPAYRTVRIQELDDNGMFTKVAARNTEAPAAPFEAPRSQPDIDHSTGFSLITGNCLYHCGNLTEYSPTLKSLSAAPYVELNDQDGRALGVSDQDRVIVSSSNAEVALTVKFNKEFPRGLAFIPENFKDAQLNRFITTEHYPCRVDIRAEIRGQS